MLRLLCLALALLLVSCASSVDRHRYVELDTVKTRVSPSPEFRGAGVPVDNKTILLELKKYGSDIIQKGGNKSFLIVPEPFWYI